MKPPTDFRFDADTHTYWLHGKKIHGVTGILKRCGLIDDRFYTPQSSERGSTVHELCHLSDMGVLDEGTVDARLAGYLAGWRRFLVDTGFVVHTSEKPMVNETWGFGGTPDKIGMAHGENWILDIKTGDIAPWVKYQLAGYEMLWMPDGNTPHERVALKLNSNGTYDRPRFYDSPMDKSKFLSMLVVVGVQDEMNNLLGR